MEETISIPEQGKIFAIRGDKASTATMLISLAERLRKKGVLFVDAAHCFNQPFVKKNYRKKEIKMDRIFVARPFTLDQQKKVFAQLKTNVIRHRAKVIVVTGFDRFINRAPYEERSYLAELLMSELDQVTRIHDCATFIGISQGSAVEQVVIDNVQMCTSV